MSETERDEERDIERYRERERGGKIYIYIYRIYRKKFTETENEKLKKVAALINFKTRQWDEG